jgi:polysaccharide export outer membrane protein
MGQTQKIISCCRLGTSLLALSWTTLVIAGCAVPPQRLSAPPDPSTPSPLVTQINSALASTAVGGPTPSADYRLGPEDLIEITLFNLADSGVAFIPRKMEIRVTQEGFITLPMLGDISVSGLTTSGVEQSLRQRYQEYIHNPQVGVQVKDYRSQRVSVMGAVRSPGVFQLSGPKTLADVLLMAGGINDRSGNQVHIYRQGSEGRHTQVIDLLALASNPELVNLPVQAGDTINVPLAGMFFVDGHVGRPGSYPLIRPYTLTQALAVAGGVIETMADYSGVTIFRRGNSPEADRISINLKEILSGQATDPPIESDDVIVVPMSTAKYIVDRFIGRVSPPRIPGFPSF